MMYQKICVEFLTTVRALFVNDNAHRNAGDTFDAVGLNGKTVMCHHRNICFIEETGEYYTRQDDKFTPATVEDTLAAKELSIEESFLKFLTENPIENITIMETYSAAECIAELKSMEEKEGFEIVPTRKFELPDGRTVFEDDLKIVQGIGPKIEGILHRASIITWKDLGETSVGMLEGLLYEAGNRYRIHDPSTWPRQARMAAAHEWQKLLDYQEEILG